MKKANKWEAIREKIAHKKAGQRYTLGKSQVDYIMGIISHLLASERTDLKAELKKLREEWLKKDGKKVYNAGYQDGRTALLRKLKTWL